MNPELSAALTALIVTIIGATITFIRAYIKARFTPAQLATVGNLASLAVEASEVLGQDNDGFTSADKLATAENSLREMAKRLGLHVSDEELSAFIHAALGNQRAQSEVPEDIIRAAYVQGYEDRDAQESGYVEPIEGPESSGPTADVNIYPPSGDVDLAAAPSGLTVVRSEDPL